MRTLLILLVGLLLPMRSLLAVSDVPGVINYQGKLLNSSGNPVVDGTYTIDFKVYGSGSGTTFLWGGTYSVVLSGGFFNVALGDGGTAIGGATYTTIASAMAATSTPFLGIRVVADTTGTLANPTEISPRFRLLSSPYSLVAQSARYADTAAVATNALTLNNLQSSAFLQPASTASTTMAGNLTVPTMASTTLTVSGSGTVGGNLAVTGTLSAGDTTGGGFVPVGAILMWAGSATAIPSGFSLCDGSGSFTSGGSTYAIPDLRDRFIVGSGSTYTQRTTGGSATVTLGLSNIPSHRHTYKDSYFAEGGGAGANTEGLGNGTEDGSVMGSHSTDYDNNIKWFRRNSDFAGGNSSGGTDAFDIRPPYYALAYIIRTR